MNFVKCCNVICKLHFVILRLQQNLTTNNFTKINYYGFNT